MFNISEIVAKWGQFGFLDGLPQHLRTRVALKYELVAHCLMNNDAYMEINFVSTNIFPIIRGIYVSGKEIGDVETFVRGVYEFYINNRETMQVHNVDMDCEMVILFVEQYKGLDHEIFKPLRCVNKHKFVKNEKPNNEEVREPMSEPTDDTVINWWDRLKNFFCNLIKK